MTRRDQIMKMKEENPGISHSEIARRLGIPQSNVPRAIRKNWQGDKYKGLVRRVEALEKVIHNLDLQA